MTRSLERLVRCAPGVGTLGVEGGDAAQHEHPNALRTHVAVGGRVQGLAAPIRCQHACVQMGCIILAAMPGCSGPNQTSEIMGLTGLKSWHATLSRTRSRVLVWMKFLRKMLL